jgi:hypothetical protein
MRGGILYARTNEKKAMLYGSAGPCVGRKRSTTQNMPKIVQPWPIKAGDFCVVNARIKVDR